MAEKKYPHEGHRDRVRERFMHVGFDNMTEQEIVEMLLFYAIPRKDTNDTAHMLLSNFGSLDGILEASAEALENCGLSRNAVAYFRMLSALCGRKGMGTAVPFAVRDSFIKELQAFRDHERVWVWLADVYGREIYAGCVSEGTVHAISSYERELLEVVVQYHASGAVILHNCFDSSLAVSPKDIDTTAKLKKLLCKLHVRLLDHLIMTPSAYVSMAADPALHELFFK